MKVQKKIVALVLCFFMIISMLPAMRVNAATNYVADVSITGLVKPKAGQTVAQNLANVRVADNANYYLESVRWWSFDEGRYLEKDDIFLLGYEYSCEIFVYTKSGYTYLGDNAMGSYSGELHVSDLTVESMSIQYNEEGEAFDFGKLYLKTYNIIVGVDGSTSVISAAYMHGLQTPKAGQKVKDNLANIWISEDNPYTVATVVWYQYGEQQAVEMNAEDMFQLGNTYYFIIEFKPKAGYIFTNDVTVYTWDLLNEGQYVISDESAANNGFLHIYGYDILVDSSAKNGFVQDDEGNWLYYENGAAQNYTGLAYDEQLGWWYVENGMINFAFDGLIEYQGTWWCVANGRVIFDYTGLWYDEVVGWWYVENGAINLNHDGLVEYEGAWWCVDKGRVAFEHTGLWYDEVVGWWHVNNGSINFSYNGFIPYDGAWWCVAEGRVAFEYTGLWNDPYAGWWYVENGAINFKYSGAVTHYGNTYNVQNGQVIF